MPSRHVVVDGSNIATEGRSLPSLGQLDHGVREYLAENPDDIVTVVVDASFGHRIGPAEVATFEEAEEAGEVVSPPAGAIGRGDAFLLRIAEKTGATVLSNDSFQEFHGEHEWLFEPGRLIGGKPVPGVGWIFTPRTPVRGPKSREAVKEAKRRRKVVTAPAAEATGLEVAAERAKERGKAKKVERAIAWATEEAVEPEDGHRRRRRRGAAPPAEPVNEPLSFITFIAAHPLGSEVTGLIESFSSHGAFIESDGARCYIPLSAMADPPPRAAREVLNKGETRTFVVQALDPLRRGVELALPGFARIAGAPTEETVEAEIWPEPEPDAEPPKVGDSRPAGSRVRARPARPARVPVLVPVPVPEDAEAVSVPVSSESVPVSEQPVPVAREPGPVAAGDDLAPVTATRRTRRRVPAAATAGDGPDVADVPLDQTEPLGATPVVRKRRTVRAGGAPGRAETGAGPEEAPGGGPVDAEVAPSRARRSAKKAAPVEPGPGAGGEAGPVRRTRQRAAASEATEASGFEAGAPVPARPTPPVEAGAGTVPAAGPDLEPAEQAPAVSKSRTRRAKTPAADAEAIETPPAKARMPRSLAKAPATGAPAAGGPAGAAARKSAAIKATPAADAEAAEAAAAEAAAEEGPGTTRSKRAAPAKVPAARAAATKKAPARSAAPGTAGTEATPAKSRPAKSRPTESRPTESQGAESQPTGSQPTKAATRRLGAAPAEAPGREPSPLTPPGATTRSRAKATAPVEDALVDAVAGAPPTRAKRARPAKKAGVQAAGGGVPRSAAATRGTRTSRARPARTSDES